MDADTKFTLARMERRLEVLVQAISALTDVVQINNAMVAEALALLKQPPSSNLPNLLETLIAVVNDLRSDIRDLPAKVARAISTGEVK